MVESNQTQKQKQNALQKGDFIEVYFTGWVKDTGEVFDSNRKEDIEKLSNSNKAQAKPLIYCLGQGMFLQGIDDYLIGKNPNEGNFEIELTPDKGFGKRDSSLIHRMPMKVFTEHNVNPVRGAMMDFDGKMGKILSVSGGRVLVDFNHPLAGKDVVYDVKVNRKVDDINEKIRAFNDLVFRKNDLKYEVSENKVTYEDPKDDKLKQLMEMFKPKFKEIFGKELEVKGQNRDTQTNEEKSSQKKGS